MSAPLLSVIVPVYNVEPYLRKCLDSLIAQTLRDIEIICVNDGCTDGCPAILDAYAARDSRITVINQANKGLSGARNAALSVARAPYITFVDSDDWVEPETYERALACMAEEVDYVAFGVALEGDRKATKRFRSYFKPHLSGEVELSEAVLLQADVCAWNKIFRRNVLEAHDIRFPEGLWYEDNYFFHLYGSFSRKAYYLPEQYYHYVCRPGSITNQAKDGACSRCLDGVKVAEGIAQYWQAHALLSERLHLLGKIFFRLAAPAIAEIRKQEELRSKDILPELLRFMEVWNLEVYPDLAYTCNLLRQKKWPGSKRKMCMGLICIKQGSKSRTITLCGVPIWRESAPRYHVGSSL